jgi:hypothetical protein
MVIRPRLMICCALLSLAGLATTASAQSSDRAKLESEIRSLHDQISEKEDIFLRPSVQDEKRYQQFLLQPQTGLCRLLPREKYEKLLVLRGGGSNYSFVRLTHEYGYGSEIGLEQGRLYASFGGANLGLITSVGDLPIESIDLRHPAAEFLAGYVAPSVEREARAEYTRINNGLSGGGDYIFYRTVPAELNNTYVMRAIEYGESDVLVAFRIVSQDSDGSITLAWRILQKFQTPELVRSEP